MSRPVRILELRSVWGTGGGPEKTILLGAAQADPSRYQVTVCYIRDERDEVFGIGERASRLPVDYVELRERHSFDRSILAKLRNMVLERGIDIVHAHEYKTDALAWWLARTTPFIPLTTAHGWTGHSTKERLLYYPGDRWLMARYPRVIAVSSGIRDVLIRAGAQSDRVEVVLNAIDPSAFRRDPGRNVEARKRFGFPSGALVLGAVGRLEPQKNFALLIDVFARVAQKHQEAVLAIAGDGSLRADLEARVRQAGLGERIRLLGHQGDIALVHHALDVLVQSSDYEGTPNAVLEAMAFENPVVATAAGGTAELARDGVEGLIVSCGDGAALERALLSVINDPASARGRAVAARGRVEHELSFNTRMARVEQIYEQLVEAYPPVAGGRRVPRLDVPA